MNTKENMLLNLRSDNTYANGNSGRFFTVASMNQGNTDAYATDTWTQIYAVIASANIVIGKKDALSFLNLIPSERQASTYSEINIDNILLERRKEFSFEGFRFHDLARTGHNIPLVSALQQTHGGPEYGNYKFAFPILKAELSANANIVQNDGYSSN